MNTTALPTPPHQAHRRYREACQRVHHEEAPLVAEGKQDDGLLVGVFVVLGFIALTLACGYLVSVVMGVML